jgi:hypothetical protein
VLACQAWLAWQDGRPDEVIRLAGQIAESDPAKMIFGGRHRWVHLFPLIAAELSGGDTAAAVNAARQIVDASQQWLPDDLTAALNAACAAWGDCQADPDVADTVAADLAAVLDLARDLNYF